VFRLPKVGISDFFLQSNKETSQIGVWIQGVLYKSQDLVLREKQVRIKKTKHKNKAKLKEREKKSKQPINPGRKHKTLFLLLGFSLFLHSIASSDISFLSHFIPK
jgi:hypothetical protein